MMIPGALYPQQPLLIVDDEENALTSMSITLRSAGYSNLRTCAESRNVPAMLAREKFSLVILDLNMPHVTGHDIIRQSVPLLNRPRMIVVTASSQIRDYAEGTAGGVVDYLVKPIDRERLIAVVRKALASPSGSSKGRLIRNFLLSDRITAGSRAPELSASTGVIDMLEQTRSEYRRLIGSLPTPYVLLDEDTFRIRYCNDAFLRFMGSDSSAVPEHVCFFDLLDAEGKAETIRRLREQGELRDEELRGRTPGGRSFVIVGSFRLSTNDGFAEGGFVDVTVPRQMELELARAHRLETVGRLAARARARFQQHAFRRERLCGVDCLRRRGDAGGTGGRPGDPACRCQGQQDGPSALHNGQCPAQGACVRRAERGSARGGVQPPAAPA